ncbi:spore protease YyaC [Paenibacillus brasilensis]|uniref:Sporulation protein YyaC n=1 Tax=Paenibacillus brasilensis TaxID=128574 RepID=A0ABU0L038_9BACL|nr:spore protease YyaC [Paenibacillus brasilensis]MDQ0495047.1 putative sporulation protein YyaC [Paenibacillus brasilensis]
MSLYNRASASGRSPLDRNVEKTDREGLLPFFRKIHDQHTIDKLTFVCIGTDRSSGDSLGPLVGTMLKEQGFPHVIGTLTKPCDADHLVSYLERIPQDHHVIAIDACLGQQGSTGMFLTAREPLTPARSVGLALPSVGHYSVAAIVNERSPKPYWTLQMTSLHLVMTMAAHIANAAAAEFGLRAATPDFPDGYRFRY